MLTSGLITALLIHPMSQTTVEPTGHLAFLDSSMIPTLLPIIVTGGPLTNAL